jgi:hypothetical protein
VTRFEQLSTEGLPIDQDLAPLPVSPEL